MSETILDLTTRVQLEPLKAGMADAVSAIGSSVGSMISDFAKLASGTAGSLEQIQGDIAELKSGFAQLSTTVSEAMAKITGSVVRGTEEGGAALANLRRELGEVAESAELSASGAISAFGPLGAIFGIGMAAHYAEGLKEVVLQTDRLSSLTGVGVARLAEFRDAMEELGVPTENISRVLVHLATEMQNAADGDKAALESFHQLGIETDNWNKKLPDTLDTLLRMSDHLHEVKGNSDDAAAAGRILGQRLGLELAGGLSAGSRAIEERMQKHKALGEEMERSVSDAKRLQEAEAEMSAKIQEAMLPLLGFFADFLTTSHAIWVGLKSDLTDLGAVVGAVMQTDIEGLTELGLVVGKVANFDFRGAYESMRSFASNIENVWHQVGENIGRENKEIQAAIDSITRQAAVTPAQRESLGGTHEGRGGVSEVLAQWKDQIQQQIDAQNAGREEGLRIEVAFWEQKIAEAKAGSAAYLAIHRELARAKKELAEEELRDVEASDRDIASLAATGTERRVQLEQKALSDISAFREAGTREYEDQLKRVVSAQQQLDEERVREESKSVDEEVKGFEHGSRQRVDAYTLEIATLQGLRQGALNSAETTEKTAAVRTTDAARQADLFKAESFRSYAEFVQKEIENVRMKFIEAQSAMVESSRKTAEESASADVKKFTEQSTEGPGGAKDIDAYYENQERHIRELASLDLVSKAQALAMIKQIETAQHEADMAKLEAEKNYIAVQMESLAAAGADVKNLAEEYKRVGKQIDDENRRFNQQMQQIDAQTWLLDEQNAQRASEIISTAFTNSFGKMLTTRTNFANVMTQFWNQLVLGFEKMGLQIVANWIQHLAMMVLQTVLTSAIMQKLLSAFGQGSAGSANAKAATAAVGKIQIDAAQTGADVFAQAIANIPFPANLAAAPGMAAAAVAQVEAFAALAAGGGAVASAEGGMDVGSRPTLALLHPQEMVLPATIANPFRAVSASMSRLNALGGGTNSGELSAGASKLFGGAGGSTTHNDNRRYEANVEVHQHSNKMSPEEIVDAVRRGLRLGH